MRAAVKRKFQPTRPLRGATDTTRYLDDIFWISTHAPLAGRDVEIGFKFHDGTAISTHAPLAGRDFVG